MSQDKIQLKHVKEVEGWLSRKQGGFNAICHNMSNLLGAFWREFLGPF